jgi:repressor of nif and glnA expression
MDLLIKELTLKGLGARKIAMEMKKRGYDVEYYHVAYKQKKLKNGIAPLTEKSCSIE